MLRYLKRLIQRLLQWRRLRRLKKQSQQIRDLQVEVEKLKALESHRHGGAPREELACKVTLLPPGHPCDQLVTAAPQLDQNVRFTLYRPRVIRPERWYPLLAFAHLSERPADAAADEADPIEEVRRQAQQVLGERMAAFQNLTQDSAQPVPREGEITLIPEIPGVEFNPPRRSFFWLENVHREEFRLRASAELDGSVARGRMSAFLGSILVAETPLTIRVESREAGRSETTNFEHSSAPPYRKIFASYSHKDVAIVEEFERYAHAVGDEYVRDVIHLRTGEMWDERLREMIDHADVFQLFWSWNSIESRFVEQEWRYALSTHRAHFLRPVYWEEPLPARPERDLPPRELLRLHFHRVHLPASTAATGDTTRPEGAAYRLKMSPPSRSGLSGSSRQRLAYLPERDMRAAEILLFSTHGKREEPDVAYGDATMSLEEHLEELRHLLSIVPFLWFIGTIVAALLLKGGWLDRILRSVVCGLAIGYPVLCVQLWRFAKPGLRGWERRALACAMGVLPVVIVPLVWLMRPVDRLWAPLLGTSLAGSSAPLIAKALIVLASLWVAVSAGASARSSARPAGRGLCLGFLAAALICAAAPAIISWGILAVLELVLVGLATRALPRRAG